MLWLEERESMEAFDFAFGPMKEPELDGFRKLAPTGKFSMCSASRIGRVSCG